VSERPKRGGLAAGAARGLDAGGSGPQPPWMLTMNSSRSPSLSASAWPAWTSLMMTITLRRHFVEALGEEDIARGEAGTPLDDGLRLLGAGALDEGGEPGDGDGHGAKRSGGIVKKR